jgi:ABC-type nitrate/sulfonate/bicarbonate transport system ATPase subunit
MGLADKEATAPAALAVEARRLSLVFETADGKVEALSNVDLQIEAGDFVSFIGPSGCGKTTRKQAGGWRVRDEDGEVREGVDEGLGLP